MKNQRDLLLHILKLSHRSTAPIANRMIKLTEEIGELSESVNHFDGYLPHKTLKEPLAGEAADSIICVLDVMWKRYSEELSDDEILDLLFEQLEKKSDKWDSILPE